MKLACACAVLMAAVTVVACAETHPVERVPVPRPDDRSAYNPVMPQKPLPPELTGQPEGQPAPTGAPGAMQPAPQPTPAQPAVMSGQSMPMLPNEPAFLDAYSKRRNPRMMVFVNRTIQGDPLPKGGLEEVMRTEERQSSTGAVSVSGSTNNTDNKNAASAGYAGTSTEVTSKVNSSSSSFSSGGPAEYTRVTSVKTAPGKTDSIGATPEDYEMIEMSIVKFFDNSGKVQIKDSEAARGKLEREKILRIENGDPAAVRLLAVELQTDVLIRVTAKPTTHSKWGQAVRLMAKAIGTTDARNLGTAFVDLPLPITKTNVNVFTNYLSNELMGEIAKKWLAPPEYDPIEFRIYKVAGVDDTLKIRKFLQGLKGVSGVKTRNATGGSSTAYATLAVEYAGAPEDLYADLKDALGKSTGLKAVDLQNNTINLEVTGQMDLVTTTQTTETKTTVETKTTETKVIEPVRPAPSQP